jgi:hypothetical protein
VVVVDATVLVGAGAGAVVVVGGIVLDGVVVEVVVAGVVVGAGSVVEVDVEVVVVAPTVVDGSVVGASRDDVVTGSPSAEPSDPPHAAPNSAAQRPIAMVEDRAWRIDVIVGSHRCVVSDWIASTVGQSSVATLPNASGRPCPPQYVVRRRRNRLHHLSPPTVQPVRSNR